MDVRGSCRHARFHGLIWEPNILAKPAHFCAFGFNNRQEFRRGARAHGQRVTRQTGGDRWIGADRTNIRADAVDDVRTCAAWCVETEEPVHRDVGMAGLGDGGNVRHEGRTFSISDGEDLYLAGMNHRKLSSQR